MRIKFLGCLLYLPSDLHVTDTRSRAREELPMNRGAYRGSAELEGTKLVVLIGAFMRGGCERQAFLLARHLRRHEGIDAQVWSLKYDGSYRQDFEAAGVPTRVLHWGQPRYGWVQRTLPVVRQLREAGVNILLPFTTWPNVVAGLAYRFSGVRLCIWG